MGPASPNISPRHGLRALVTRPRAEAEGLARALEERGIAAIVEPLLEVYYRDVAPPDFTGVQAILCTSGNGVRALARLSAERDVPLLAVGEATASRAREAQFRQVESAGGAVEDLIGLARRRLRPDSGRLIHIAGSVVAGDLAAALRTHGFTVERAVLYEAHPAAGLSAATSQALAARIVDFALFFSPRTAAVFAGLTAAAGLAAALRSLTAISLSAAAEAALGDLPFRRRLIAEQPDQSGLLASLDRVLGERRRA